MIHSILGLRPSVMLEFDGNNVEPKRQPWQEQSCTTFISTPSRLLDLLPHYIFCALEISFSL